MVPLLTVERGLIGVGGLFLLILLENVWPFRRRVEARLKRYWINFFISGTNILLLNVLLGGLILGAYHSFELQQVGLLHRLGVETWLNVILTVFFLDVVTYLWHRAYHQVPFMWRMHRVHHSDRDLDVTTSQRFHMTEMCLSAVFRLGVITLWGASLASVVIFEILFGILNQLEHSNVHFPRPFETWLRSLFVTPDMHRIHHSQVRQHTQSNYGTIFSFWDRLFGTYRFGADQRALVLGLPEYPQGDDVTLGKVLVMPFGRPCGFVRNIALYLLAGMSLALLAGLLIWGGGETYGGRVGPATPDAREIELTYRAELTHIPDDAEVVDMWVPLAKTRNGQEILRREVRSTAPYTISQEPEYHNDILHLRFVPPFPDSFKVEIAYNARLRGDTPLPEEEALSTDDFGRYSMPRGLVIVDDEVRIRANRATEGKLTVMERARGIYDDVIGHMAYDKIESGWGNGNTLRACLVGKGNCTDFHSLFISMARAERIPARFKIGLVVPQETSGFISGYHCWAEFYEEGRGWIAVDASQAWKRPELVDYYFGTHVGSRLVISMGREFDLVPRQQDGPVNIFFYPRVEVNGRKFSEIEVEFQFEEKETRGVI